MYRKRQIWILDNNLYCVIKVQENRGPNTTFKSILNHKWIRTYILVGVFETIFSKYLSGKQTYYSNSLKKFFLDLCISLTFHVCRQGHSGFWNTPAGGKRGQASSSWEVKILVDHIRVFDSPFQMALKRSHRQTTESYKAILSQVPLGWTVQTCCAPGWVCTCPSLSICISLKGSQACLCNLVCLYLSVWQRGCLLSNPACSYTWRTDRIFSHSCT